MMTTAEEMPMGAYSRRGCSPMSTIAVSAISVTNITDFQKFSHCETEREKTGGASGGAAGGTVPEEEAASDGAARSRNSPQCLHFFAMARITWPQNRQPLAGFAAASASTGVVVAGAG